MRYILYILAGKGYPKKLSKEQTPVTGRMMAIADIFQTLTVLDRLYKKAKTLSEAIRILGFMKKDNHIDPDLFDLFLSLNKLMKSIFQNIFLLNSLL